MWFNVEFYAARTGNNNRQVGLYARVISRAQQPDLKREKMLALVKRQLSGNTWMVVVSHQDRLEKYAGRQAMANEVDLFR